MNWGAIDCIIRSLTIIYYIINSAFSELDLVKKLEFLRKIQEKIVIITFNLLVCITDVLGNHY